MGQSIHDVLLALGAKNVRDATSKENALALDLELLEVRSVFGGALKGEAMVQVSSREAFAFQRPKELAQCGTLWLPGVETVEAVSQAIVDAHDTLRARLEDDQESLRKLGFTPRLVSPDPRARALVDVDDHEVQVAIDANGDLVLELIAGQRVPSEHGRVFAPEDVSEHEALERLAAHVSRVMGRGLLDEDDESDRSAPAIVVAPTADGFDVDVDGSDAGAPGSNAWAAEEVSRTASMPVHETQASRHLSDNQLAELHAALSEDSEGGDDPLADDEDDHESSELVDASDEAEPIIDGDDDDDDAQADVVARARDVVVHPVLDDDDDDDLKTISIHARKPSSLLRAADAGVATSRPLPPSELEPAPQAASFVDDYDEPTSAAIGGGRTLSEKRPSVAGAASTSLGREGDRGPGDGGASEASVLRVDDFPALPPDSQDSEPAQTTVSAPDSDGPALGKHATVALPVIARTSDEDVESVAAGFDDGEGERLAPQRAPPPGPRTMEEPPLNVPTKGTVSQPAEPPEDLLPSAAASEEGSASMDEANSEIEDALVARLGEASPIAPAAPLPHAPIADDELEDANTAQTRAIFLPGNLAALQPAQTQAAMKAVARGPGTLDIASSNGGIAVEDADVLEARAGALEEEARALRERAERLRHGKRAATTLSFDASMAGATSLPILASMEVHAISSVSDATAALEVAVPASMTTVATAGARVAAGLEAGPMLEPHEGVSLADVQAALDDVAAISGEATHVGRVSDGRVTDVRNRGVSGDGDVFESAGPRPVRKQEPTRVRQHDVFLSDRLPSSPPGEESLAVDMDDEADAFSPAVPAAPSLPRTKSISDKHVNPPSNLGGIGLVVEDARARDRLKKHLTPRFRRLVEAPDAMTAAGLPEVSDVEALVFVRPRPDDATREGIEQICDGPMPPRILIISSDARFDDMPEVSLRLPLGQRASEVAQQVLDGLKTLGVETLEADP